jgi:hypothetical protein
MKGQIEIAILGMIAAIIIPVGLFLPIIFLRVHLVADIQFLAKNNQVQLILLSLLSSTISGKPTSQIISEHVAFNTYPNIDKILADQIGKYTSCYRISADEKVLSASSDPSCDPTKYISETTIPLPYSSQKTSTTITLGIG